RGLIVLRTPRRDNADALADALRTVGYATTWPRYNRTHTATRGALAAIWDGGQLSETEANDLTAFCTQMSRDGAPVISLLHFPRRDGVERAYKCGATAVIGKPWFNADLLATLESLTNTPRQARAA